MDEAIEDTYQDRLERENARLRAELAHERFLREQAEARETGRDDGRAIVRAEVLRELLEWEAHYMQQARGGDQSGRSDARADAAREIHDNLRSSWETRERVAMEWQPIETAPRDGLLLLLCTDGGIVFVGKLNKHLQLWVDDQGRERFRTVSYWMPLPAPPSNSDCTEYRRLSGSKE